MRIYAWLQHCDCHHTALLTVSIQSPLFVGGMFQDIQVDLSGILTKTAAPAW